MLPLFFLQWQLYCIRNKELLLRIRFFSQKGNCKCSFDQFCIWCYHILIQLSFWLCYFRWSLFKTYLSQARTEHHHTSKLITYCEDYFGFTLLLCNIYNKKNTISDTISYLDHYAIERELFVLPFCNIGIVSINLISGNLESLCRYNRNTRGYWRP